tara:strand:+ start:41 stop:559 length:519 start_codon:yes stop_codon:yes gene_type:complete
MDFIKMSDKKIADALGINLNNDDKNEIIKKPVREITVDPEKKEEIDQKSDYNLVRKNLRGIIETGQGAIDGILNVASEGESPRAYEVVSQLIKTVADANRDLLDIHKKMKEINKESDKAQQSANSITNNAIYVGSTKDLQKLIKDSKNEADTIDAEYEVIDDESGKPTDLSG